MTVHVALSDLTSRTVDLVDGFRVVDGALLLFKKNIRSGMAEEYLLFAPGVWCIAERIELET